MTQEIRILLVENSIEDSELITRSLRRSGPPFVVAVVANVDDFISHLTDAPPNLILAGFSPTLDARTVLKVLRDRQLDIPLIVVAGTLTDEVARLCLKEGAVDYVLENRLVRLPAAIRRALAEEKLRRARSEDLTWLRRSEERFRQIANSVGVVLSLTDSINGQTIYASPAYEKIWGRSPESLYSSSESRIDSVHPEDRDRVRNVMQSVAGNYDIEYRIVRPDGTLRWIHERGFPVHDAQELVYRIAAVAEDITHRRQLE